MDKKEKRKNKGKKDRCPSMESKNRGNRSNQPPPFPPSLTPSPPRCSSPFSFIWRHSPLFCKVNSG